MPEPVAAMKRVHDALRPGSHAVMANWGPPAKNP